MLEPRKALGHNRNVCDLRRPCGQHGTVGDIENGIHCNLTRPLMTRARTIAVSHSASGGDLAAVGKLRVRLGEAHRVNGGGSTGGIDEARHAAVH